MAEKAYLGASVYDDDWVLYKNRKEWKDVEPVPQDDGPYPVVSIAYSEKFKDVYSYFRAILKSQEKSERALELTADALELNPANYTVWQYRRVLLQHLQKDLKQELLFVRGMIEENEKNYQVWHHRRVIIERLNDPSQELKFTDIILSKDAKNYHAWQYRQWIIKTFDLYDNELEFVERLLLDDVRNNSAWNQRYFVIKNKFNFAPNVLEFEIDFTLDKIMLVNYNESPWNYLRGIISHCPVGSELYLKVCRFCEELYNEDNRSPYLMAFLVDLCDELADHNISYGSLNIAFALELCDLLANTFDKIRNNYWKYISRTLSSKQKNGENSETINDSV